MMEVLRQLRDFQDELVSVANELSAAGARQRSYDDDDGTTYRGWEVDYGDFPHVEDLNPPGTTPYYMGGRWGNWELFLASDGRLYRYEFRGQDWYVPEKDDVDSSQSNRVRPADLSQLIGTGKPLFQIRKKVEAAAMKAILAAQG